MLAYPSPDAVVPGGPGHAALVMGRPPGRLKPARAKGTGTGRCHVQDLSAQAAGPASPGGTVAEKGARRW